MYLPKHFEEMRVPVLHDLMRTYPLAALVTLTVHGLDANHLPFEIDPEPTPFGILRGHIARVNPLWRDLASGTPSLAIFQGPDTYISPSWYPSKKETGKVVPTWNYVVVHAHGPLYFIDDKVWLRQLVDRLTNRYEAGRSEPWRTTDAPDDYIDKMLGAIVGVEIPITQLTGKWKVSQNRPAEDRQGVVAGLRQEGTEAAAVMAELVRRVG
ncbi:MAG: FMN-binding negative transcriptional regulator [Deltaproteobacteria bacterium]|nr:FMN-binding negative transcriptional regulator [Deltaproteobacteria bacterium]